MNPSSDQNEAGAPVGPGPVVEKLPPELKHAYQFSIFNALSYPVVLGSPMVLYAKTLEASATVLGVIAGMMPLLVIFQIPAARHIGRIGYKQFVFAGWGTRVMFIFLIALVPLTSGFLSAQNRIVLAIFLLFGFNLSRGISSAAWLPWITALVPAAVRGKYLARDSACVNGGCGVALLFSGWMLSEKPSAWQFAAVFLFSALMGMASLRFLKRIPDVAPPENRESTSKEPVPWGAILGHPPFKRLLWMNLAWAIAYGGLGAFTVAYMKSEVGWGENRILYLTGVSYLGGLGGLALFGHRLDRHGSKPVLMLCLGCWVIWLGAWTALAGGVVEPSLAVLVVLQLGMGLGYAVFMMANTRLAMLVAPPMGREHFFALFSVVHNVTLGIAPIFWGIFLDAIGARHGMAFGFAWNRYSAFFLAVTLVFALGVWRSSRLEEPQAGNVERLLRDFLEQNHPRSWIRFWPR